MNVKRILFILNAGLIALVAVAATVAAPQSAVARDDGDDLSVMTQNLYIGTDLQAVFAATSFPALLAGVESEWAKVQSTNFPERAHAIAATIDEHDPDVISVQEAILFRTGPAFDPAQATDVRYDYLQILIDALAARGLRYEAAAVVTNADIELPTGTLGIDIRVTDRDALLVRSAPHGRGVEVVAAASGNYVARASLPSVAGPLVLQRGWVSVDVRSHGRTVRVVGTHLEVSTSPVVQAAQASELLNGPANTSMPVILAGDFNSAAAGTVHATPTYAMLRAAGFDDAWAERRPREDGFTCCQAADLRNVTSQLNARIDLILMRGRFEVETVRRLIGQTPSGLWQSDHAGVVADLELRRN